jgi:small subunit ribosomal protein S15
MLTVKEKSKLIEKYKVHDKDTGSPEVQVAITSQEIDKLAQHLEDHPKDNHSRRGLLKMVAKRRSLLAYLSHNEEQRYKTLIKKLGLKK